MSDYFLCYSTSMSFFKNHWRAISAVLIPIFAAAATVTTLTVIIPKYQTATSNVGQTTMTSDDPVAVTPQTQSEATAPAAATPAATQYGDKYANGLLPVGDGKYSTTTASKGSILLCQSPNTSGGPGGGADTRGPWFTSNNTQYDINKKIAVSGNIKWDGNYTMKIVNGNRIITTNDVPSDHTTGVFPIKSSDAAYLYDHNPNTIKLQSLSFTFPAAPVALSKPGCMSGGTIGVMTTGVALFNGFDAEGRDAGAWEIQDSCGGHPQQSGEYHYHTLSSCITDVSSTKVIGYAADGYPITGPTVSKGNIMTTTDLDECHGTTSSIMLDGTMTNAYHYVMTQDFPYSISCFKAASKITKPGIQ